MYVFRPQFPRHELVRPAQPPDPVKKDPSRVRWFRRFFKDPESDSHEQRAGDLKLKSTWSNILAVKRLLIQGELASIAAKSSDAEVPECSLRVERISIAMYLLGRANAIIRKTPGPVPFPLWSPLVLVTELLDKLYFTEPAGSAAPFYNAIKSSLEAQGYHILDSDAAAKQYLKHVKKRVAQMRAGRREPPSHVDLTA